MSALVVLDRPLTTVLALWGDARLRNWTRVPVSYPGWRWASHDRHSWFTYRSGDDFAVSCVEACHRGRTLGVVDATEAVIALRWFLGWPG